MFSEKDYVIAFEGLKLGKHQFSYILEDAFFDAFEHGLIEKGKVDVELLFEKMSTMMILNFVLKGEVQAECGLCLENLSVEIESENRLIVKFGDNEDDANDELVIIPHSSYQMNIMHYLFEFVHLALPSRVVHEEGDCDQDMIDQLNDRRADDKPDDIDPRWEALKGLN